MQALPSIAGTPAVSEIDQLLAQLALRTCRRSTCSLAAATALESPIY